MADLNFYQGADPTVVVDESTGYQLKPNLDGSINVAGLVANTPTATSISKYVGEGKVFTVSAAVNMVSSGADNALVLIRNPSGSGKILYLYRTIVGIDVQNTFANFRLKYAPTVTATGTAITPRNNYVGNATASTMNVYTLPTATGGTQLSDVMVGQNTNSFDFLGDFSIWLAANQDLMLTGAPSGPNKEASVTIVWAEV